MPAVSPPHAPPGPGLAPPPAAAGTVSGGDSLRRAIVAPLRGETSLRSTSELEELLRRRLRAVLLFSTVGGVLLSLPLLVIRWPRYAAAPARLFTARPFIGVILILATFNVPFIALLAPQRRPSLRLMRAIEWALLLPSAAFCVVLYMPILASVLAEEPRFVLIVAQGFSVMWVFLMFAYAMFIPNSWWRCAAAVGLLLLCAVLPDAIVLTRSALVARPLAWLYLSTKTVLLVMAAIGAIYGSYRVAILQEDAAAARRLGQYVLREPLGSGGMGEVYRAEHQLLRRPCAVKLIRPEQAGDAATLARFEREVQATATLTHPNTVQVYDYGRADDGTFYYAMEYLPGVSLEQLVERHGPMPPARVIHILSQVCGALAEAQARGLVHRDIKPSNVILCERGGVHDVAKLLDFGLVAPLQVGAGDARLTQQGLILGTPAFMSPEQCAGEDAGPPSDIYSLGALGYFLLTGRAPFAGRSPVQMLAAHLYEAPARLSTYGVAVPPELEAVIVRCLAKAPADRFADAGSLAAALRDAGGATPAWSERDAREWWDRQAPDSA